MVAAIAFDVDSIEYPIATVTLRLAEQSEGLSGFSRGRQVYERPKRTLSLSWARATEGIVYQIIDLWNQTLGGIVPMAWTPIDGTTGFDVRFGARPDLVLTRTARGQWQCTLTLEEAL